MSQMNGELPQMKRDMRHYQKIVVAINETIKIMAKIDEVIDAHGG